MVQWFGEDIGSVVVRPDTVDFQIAKEDLFAYVVVFDANVFDTRVPDVVFSEFGSGVVVTQEGGGARGKKFKGV